MCYFDHKVMMTLQLGAWQTQRPLRPHEREQEYHARLNCQKQARMQDNLLRPAVAPRLWRQWRQWRGLLTRRT